MSGLRLNDLQDPGNCRGVKFGMSSASGRVLALDGFRGVCVLAIVFLHYIVHHINTQPGSLLAYAQRYLMSLWMAVDGFFVLSGFLITGILLDNQTASNLFQVFYLRRAFRILPPYLLLLAAWMAVQLVGDGKWDLHWLMEPKFASI